MHASVAETWETLAARQLSITDTEAVRLREAQRFRRLRHFQPGHRKNCGSGNDSQRGKIWHADCNHRHMLGGPQVDYSALERR